MLRTHNFKKASKIRMKKQDYYYLLIFLNFLLPWKSSNGNGINFRAFVTILPESFDKSVQIAVLSTAFIIDHYIAFKRGKKVYQYSKIYIYSDISFKIVNYLLRILFSLSMPVHYNHKLFRHIDIHEYIVHQIKFLEIVSDLLNS